MSITDKHSIGGEQWTSTGGSQMAAVASGASATVKSEAGRLCRVLVTQSGTAGSPVLIYDSASGASGTIVGVVPGNASAGSVYEFDMPCAAGVYVAGVSSGPALTVSFF